MSPGKSNEKGNSPFNPRSEGNGPSNLTLMSQQVSQKSTNQAGVSGGGRVRSSANFWNEIDTTYFAQRDPFDVDKVIRECFSAQSENLAALSDADESRVSSKEFRIKRQYRKKKQRSRRIQVSKRGSKCGLVF